MKFPSKLWQLLPLSLLLWGCQNTDREQESARQVVEVYNRAQQAYFIEKGQFTDRLADLQLGWFTEPQKTPHYRYSLQKLPHTIPGSRNQELAVQTIGITERNGWKNYIGIAWIAGEEGELVTRSLLCAGTTTPPPITIGSSTTCPEGFQWVPPQQTDPPK